jgi:hypothetical protein
MVGASLNRVRRTQPSTAQSTGVNGSGEVGAGARNGLSKVVTTLFRNPMTPAMGAVTDGVGAIAAATAAVARSTCGALATAAATVGIVLGLGSDVEDRIAAPISLAVLVGVDDATAGVDFATAVSAVACDEFDSLTTGFDVGAGVGEAVVDEAAAVG